MRAENIAYRGIRKRQVIARTLEAARKRLVRTSEKIGAIIVIPRRAECSRGVGGAKAISRMHRGCKSEPAQNEWFTLQSCIMIQDLWIRDDPAYKAAFHVYLPRFARLLGSRLILESSGFPSRAARCSAFVLPFGLGKMPDPRNPRILPSRRHPFAIDPGTGGFEDRPQDAALSVKIESRHQLICASEQAAKYILYTQFLLLDGSCWKTR